MTRQRLTPGMAADAYAKELLSGLQFNEKPLNRPQIEFLGSARAIAESVCHALVLFEQPDEASYDTVSDLERRDAVDDVVAFAIGSLSVTLPTNVLGLRSQVRGIANIAYSGGFGDIVSSEEYATAQYPNYVEERGDN